MTGRRGRGFIEFDKDTDLGFGGIVRADITERGGCRRLEPDEEMGGREKLELFEVKVGRTPTLLGAATAPGTTRPGPLPLFETILGIGGLADTEAGVVPN